MVPSTHTKRDARPARPAGFGGACGFCLLFSSLRCVMISTVGEQCDVHPPFFPPFFSSSSSSPSSSFLNNPGDRGERGDRGDRQFDKEKRMGPDGSFQPTYVSVGPGARAVIDPVVV